MNVWLMKTWQKLVWLPLVVVGVAIALTLSISQPSVAQEVIRYPIPNSDFPIAQAVEVPGAGDVVYVSGQVPPMIDESAEPSSIAAFGDTKTQTINVLERIQGILERLELTMGDVVKMQVFLVGDPALDGQMDFAGFMEGYTQFFGTEEQPNLPARSAMQVAGLVNPGWLVEIEVTAVRPE
jgi:enamine deaminase RidA (YjgF/YER057c/UK114 family)